VTLVAACMLRRPTSCAWAGKTEASDFCAERLGELESEAGLSPMMS
jgi:hypothetical protein